MNMFNKYIEMAVIQMECTYSGDYRRGNKASTQLEKMNMIFKNNFDENREIIDKLEQISCNQNLGIIRFNAEMVLKTHMR